MKSATRADHESRLNDERRRAERGKHVVVLMLNHLLQMGYAGSVDALQSESGLLLSQYEPADNVDLVSVLQEWEDYYEMRFQRRPKVVRKLSAYSDKVDPHGAKGARRALEAAVGSRGGRAHTALPSVHRTGSSISADDLDDAPDAPTIAKGSGAGLSRQPRTEAGAGGTAAERALAAVGAANGSGGSSHASGRGTPKAGTVRGAVPASDGAGVNGITVTGTQVSVAREMGGGEAPGPWENRLRKAGLPPAMAASSELRELAATIQRDMVQSNPNVRWEAIAELDGVKRVLKESLVMPLRWPHLFTGLLAPWKGVLLYGPPGTGKTLLAKAVATECSTVFFNISASSIVSKWRGDSEKLVRVLFELARHHSPATIFIDEIDSIMSARGDSGEHEGSRRMKTELLVQMDGLMANDAQVFVLAATNLPWELDSALLRRLEKRVLVPLPSSSARSLMLRHTLPADRLSDNVDLDAIAQQAEGYSGSDLVLVCKEAAMRPLRKLLSRLDAAPGGGGYRDGALPQPDRVREEDLRAALACTRPTVSQFGARYKEWEAEFGSV